MTTQLKSKAEAFLNCFFTNSQELGKLCHPNVELYWREEKMIAELETLIEFGEGQGKCFPDIQFKVMDMIAEENKIAVRLVQSGSLQSKWAGIDKIGARFQACETMFFYFEEGLIRKIYPVLDIEQKKETLLSSGE